jgi:hypothetical protein
LKEWITLDFRNTPSTINLEEEKTVMPQEKMGLRYGSTAELEHQVGGEGEHGLASKIAE